MAVIATTVARQMHAHDTNGYLAGVCDEMVVAMESKRLDRFVPTEPAAVAMAMATTPAISPYSIAVTPLVSRISRVKSSLVPIMLFSPKNFMASTVLSTSAHRYHRSALASIPPP